MPSRSTAPAFRSSSPLPRVAVLVETSTSWGRGVHRGIVRWAESFGPWSLFVEPAGRHEHLTLPANWKGDGVIARVNGPELADQLLSRHTPCVDISWYRLDDGRLPHCTADPTAAGQMLARYLLDRGYRNLAYIGPSYYRGHTDYQLEACQAIVLAAGAKFHRFRRAPGAEQHPMPDLVASYSRWLEKLPKPLAVIAFDSTVGRQAIEACAASGIAVPDQVAVLAAEYDELQSDLLRPKLSALDSAAETVGFEAGRLLAGLMAGEPAPSKPVLIPPAGIITRRSTDTLAVEDAHVIAALRFIQEHFHEPVKLRQIVAHLRVSRRALQLRFQNALGRSPSEELTRIRIGRAKELLKDTDLNLDAIAHRCGYRHVEVMARAFKRLERIAPTQYRSQAER